MLGRLEAEAEEVRVVAELLAFDEGERHLRGGIRQRLLGARGFRVQIEEHDQADAERGDRQDERLDVHPGGETEHSRGDHLERCKK